MFELAPKTVRGLETLLRIARGKEFQLERLQQNYENQNMCGRVAASDDTWGIELKCAFPGPTELRVAVILFYTSFYS